MKKLLLLLISLPSIASAWGGTGHEIICGIAFQELTSEAQEEVVRLVQLDAEFDSFSESCRWADSPRKRASDHYLNVPRDLDVITTEECPLAESCLFTALRKDLEILSDQSLSDQMRLDALKFLGHWIGDIHQPLHVSYQDDRGANSIGASGKCRGNLHGVWDGCILERQFGKDAAAITNDFLTRIADDDRHSWQLDSHAVWADESYQLTKSPETGYCTMKDGACWYWSQNKTLDEGELQREMIITQDYLSANQGAIELRLQQAGIRLGAVLNQALKGH